MVAAELVRLAVLDAARGKETRVTEGSYFPADAVAIAPDGRYVICGGGGQPSLTIFDTSTW